MVPTEGDAAAIERATDLFRALSNPVRLQIVQQLATGQQAVHELVAALDVAQPRISEHLAILRAARLVARERQGRTVTYRLVDDHVAHIVADAVIHAAEV